MSDPNETPAAEEAAATTAPSASPVAEASADADAAGLDDELASATLAADGNPTVPATVPEPQAPRRGFGEWLLRRRELAEKQGQLAALTGHALALRRGKAALAFAEQAAHPVDPSPEGGGAAISLGLALEAMAWGLAAQAHLPNAVPSPSGALAAADHELLLALAGNEDELRALEQLAAEDFVARAGRGEADVAADAAKVRRIADDLLHRAEAPRREVDAIRVARVFRLGTLFALLGLVLFGGFKGVELATLPRDLAKGKPWKASSAYPNFNLAEHTCDGTETYVFFHTREEEHPWFEIDLGAPQMVRRLDVRNRMDGLRDRAVPIIAEVSENGREWREVSRRTTTFETWTAKFAPVKARYVRLKVLKRTFFHLEQVAVR